MPDLRFLSVFCAVTASIALALACTDAAAPKPPPNASPARAALNSGAAATPRCRDYEPERRAFFGDTHIHSSLSMDAWIIDTRATPEDAYRFSRGEAVAISSGRSVQLERPLDFAAVTDHAEFLAEVALCTDAGSSVHGARSCGIYRGEVPARGGAGGRMAALTTQIGTPVLVGGLPLFDRQRRSSELCGEDGERCRRTLSSVWQRAVAAASSASDTTPECRFTAFAAYEYSLTPRLSKIHRNIIFANDTVPALPTSAVEEPEPLGLWRQLASQCLDAGTGCDAVSIPHNSNLSNGRMFQIEYRAESLGEQREQAALRARVEPLVEIMQVKGDSECRNGMAGVAGAADELCEFEKFRAKGTEDCFEGSGEGALGGIGCISRRDFVRYALVEGLREEARIGVNPFKLGITASTDTHNGTPGDTEEASYDGAHGLREETPVARLKASGEILPPIRANPGGLFGIWAEENSRPSLFGAMKRRETFGTSGTRIAPRLFASWDWSPGSDPCSASDPVAEGYAHGVPMGSDLPPSKHTGAPSFLATALRDPGTSLDAGARLERIQIVKGWVGTDGQVHQAVFDVAGAASSAIESVDAATCQPRPGGHDALCSVWRDPDFDPDRAAVYYARVLERPSCRWSARQCVELGRNGEALPPGCDDSATPKTIRERAWTSPIWYSPRATRQ